MSKELQAFRDILGILSAVSGCEVDMNSERIITVQQALQRLEAIDNANPSEALRLVKRTCELYVDSLKQRDLIGYDIIEKQINEALDTIKQALIKVEKEHNSVNLLMQELDCKDFADLRKYARCGYEKMNEKLIQ